MRTCGLLIKRRKRRLLDKKDLTLKMQAMLEFSKCVATFYVGMSKVELVWSEDSGKFGCMVTPRDGVPIVMSPLEDLEMVSAFILKTSGEVS